MFVIFFHVSYSFWPLNQNILIILTSITALFNQKHSLNVICVGYFTFNLIRSRPTALPTD